MRTRHLLWACIITICFAPSAILAQTLIGSDLPEINYSKPSTYTIGGITVKGTEYLDPGIIVVLSGLTVGDKVEIPGDKIRNAIEKLWEQGLFENIRVVATRFEGDYIFLEISLSERPRLTRFSFLGIRKSEADDLREKIRVVVGDVVTDNLVMRTSNIITKHFSDKGYLSTEVNILRKRDTVSINNVELIIEVKKNNRVRIERIELQGNSALSDQKIKRQLKNTKERGVVKPFDSVDSLLINSAKAIARLDIVKLGESVGKAFANDINPRIFKSSRLIESDFKDDKEKLIQKYNELGYRDARITSDSIYRSSADNISIKLNIDEGPQYYFRNITWIGNTKFSTEALNSVLGIRKGDIYNQKILDTHLSYNPNGIDISSLYLDDGYLFFRVTPVEVLIENDSIDLELRIYEGKQATINRVSIKGNTRTNEHVVIRELRTQPGQLFNRSDIIRSVRDLAQLRYFDAEKINPVPSPNPTDGTVDINYEVEETSSDQIELSGGWGYGRVIGTLGVSFNNFSTRNIFKKGAWRPVPTGDGQKLSIRLQSYGTGYISYSASFTEPWLGGKKPNSFSASYSHSLFSNGYSKSSEGYGDFKIDGFSLMLGKRLTWPDDFFVLIQNVSYQRYSLNNWGQIFSFGSGSGVYNSVTYGITFGRKSVDAPIYPRSGSDFTLGLNITPPYSAFSNKNYKNLDADEKYKWIEYHKWNISTAWYQTIVDKLVFSVRSRYGFLGLYNRDIGVTPFGRYFLGGDGLSGGYNYDGREIIAFRGYSNESMTPEWYRDKSLGGTIFNKNTLELRYPLSLNPSATIYALAFVEAGGAWLKFKNFNPFDLKRSAGVGVRVFLPMFGLLGLDWGYGFDPIPGVPGANKGQFHFSINQSID
ncbi:MAG: POTRA domain-containing protein [Bacteroidales bacterium]|nr:POTRA domain-containing protein [Bacteroidales bacterium]MDZ4204585.1 POTRA domain-containing protein [Bacteroidales bacterium]